MNWGRIVSLIASVGLGQCLIACQRSQQDSVSLRRTIIAAAQVRSFRGANPKWLELTDKEALFRLVRDHAYSYCLSQKSVDLKCTAEQDDAVEASVLALKVAVDQAAMTDKKRLGLKEHYVATNPIVATSVENACWALYKAHGSQDARILSVCLGNLTDYSPLIPLPVP